MVARHTQYIVRIIVGPEAGEEFVLAHGKPTVIGGAADADIRLSGPNVSDRHAILAVADDELELELVAPSAKVKVNGANFRGGRLHNGDQLALGKSTMRVIERARTGEPGPAEAPIEEREVTPRVNAELTLIAKGEPGEGGRKGAARETLERGPPSRRPPKASFAEESGIWWSPSDMPPRDLQHVWFDLVRRGRFRSLALVPAEDGLPVLAVAHAFARMASLDPAARVLVVDASPDLFERPPDEPLISSLASAVTSVPGASYELLDATALGLNQTEVAHIYIPQLLEYISTQAGRHNRVLIALGSVVNHAHNIPVARAVDGVVLAVATGRTRIPNITLAADIVGKERVIGSIVLKPRSKPPR